MKFFTTVAFLSLALAGCSRNTLLEVQDYEGNDANFLGIADLINADKDTNILFIHGMAGYVSKDGVIDPCYVMNDVRGAFNLSPKAFDVHSSYFCRDEFITNNKKVYMEALHWRNVTFFAKEHLEDIDSDALFANNRAGLSTLAKSSVINQGFSDALLYTGSYHETILENVTDSISRINQKNPNAKTVIVTFSLGSAILLDGLRKLPVSDKQLLAGNVEMVYMMANQVPLISLGRVNPPYNLNDIQGQERVAEDLLRKEYSVLSEFITSNKELAVDSSIKVVAFSDPNDLLSYPLDPESMGTLEQQYANVAISVAPYTYWVPFLKKYSFANYMTAHTGYVHNDKLKQLLIYGKD